MSLSELSDRSITRLNFCRQFVNNTGVTSTQPSDVIDGDLDAFMAAALSQRVTGERVDVEDVD